jgi:serine/threonine protein kinase
VWAGRWAGECGWVAGWTCACVSRCVRVCVERSGSACFHCFVVLAVESQIRVYNNTNKKRVVIAGKHGHVTDGMYRGTDEYMAPEVSAGKDSTYGLPADIWSLGVMTYELMFGRLCKPERESFTRRLVEAVRLLLLPCPCIAILSCRSCTSAPVSLHCHSLFNLFALFIFIFVVIFSLLSKLYICPRVPALSPSLSSLSLLTSKSSLSWQICTLPTRPCVISLMLAVQHPLPCAAHTTPTYFLFFFSRCSLSLSLVTNFRMTHTSCTLRQPHALIPPIATTSSGLVLLLLR